MHKLVVGKLLIMLNAVKKGEKMLSVAFSVICILSVIWSIFSGNTEAAASAILAGAGRAVEITLSLVGIMSLWNGVMAVLRESGAIEKLTVLLSPIMKIIFKKPCSEAVACLSANLLGIGNAATPLGISALKKMQRGSDTMSDDSIMLTVLCCGAVSLIPTTVFALRRADGGNILFEILPVIWLVGIIGVISSVCLTKLFGFLWRRIGK